MSDQEGQRGGAWPAQVGPLYPCSLPCFMAQSQTDCGCCTACKAHVRSVKCQLASLLGIEEPPASFTHRAYTQCVGPVDIQYAYL